MSPEARQQAMVELHKALQATRWWQHPGKTEVSDRIHKALTLLEPPKPKRLVSHNELVTAIKNLFKADGRTAMQDGKTVLERCPGMSYNWVETYSELRSMAEALEYPQAPSYVIHEVRQIECTLACGHPATLLTTKDRPLNVGQSYTCSICQRPSFLTTVRC